MELDVAKTFATAFVVGFGVLGPSIGIGLIGMKAMEAMARNPEQYGKIQAAMLIGIAFTEALGIFALVVGFIIMFV